MITGWLCPGCNGRSVPLDHFEKASCGRTHVHPHYANAVLAKERDHYSRGSKIVSVTQGLGCPRKSAILESVDISVNPMDMNASITGTAFHALMESAPHYAEAAVEVHVSGVLDGIPVQGRPDVYWPAKQLIEDFKHSNDFMEKYRQEAKPDHIVQQSLYAELIEQSGKPRPVDGIVWYHYTAHGLKPKAFKVLPLREALDFKPHGSPLSVINLLRAMHNFYRGVTKWQDLAMAGEDMAFGSKTACDYCEARSVCWTEAKGAPF